MGKDYAYVITPTLSVGMDRISETIYLFVCLAAWLSGNALVLTNVVALRRARLVVSTGMGDCSRVYHL